MNATGLLALCAVVLPVVLSLNLSWRGPIGRVAEVLAPWAALPALALAVAPIAYPPLETPWVLLGILLDLDPTGRVFLILFALLWTAAGVYARYYVPEVGRRRFYAFYLLTMAGNLGLPLAGDAPTFYLLFAVMTFSGYGLVIHRGDGEARRAGRIYIALAVVGEGFLLIGLLIATTAAGTLLIGGIPGGLGERAGIVTACLLVGFGIKAGAVPLHVWLPLAHPVAPTPASAVLSGSMIKAGLLGWIRFLPLGEISLEGWGALIATMGFVAAFFGVLIGVLQTDPKTVLAYSSISQMGVMNIGLGIGLAAQNAATAAIGAVTVYALHHGLAKGALFLGVGVAADRPTKGPFAVIGAAGLILPALAIAGAPFTSGSLAKGGLKALLPLAPASWPGWIEHLLPLSAFATTLLMARFLHLTFRRTTGQEVASARNLGIWVPWAGLLVAVAIGTPLVSGAFPLPGAGEAYPGSLTADLLPIVAGMLAFWAIGARGPGWDRWPEPPVAQGDLIVPIERWISARRGRPRRAPTGHDPVLTLTSLWYDIYAESRRDDLVLRIEMRMTRWAPSIAIACVLMAVILALFLVATP